MGVIVEGEFVKAKNVCFTGHRKIPSEQINDIVQRLKNIIVELINDGYTDFYAGGALGFDTIAAQTVMELKKKYPQIKLILALPCMNQTSGWNESDKRMYECIRAIADKVVYTSDTYFNGCMQKRNRYLVDNSSICVCYLTENKGGTAYTVGYAKSKNLTILNVAK